MKYFEFEGQNISRIGLGLAALGRPGYINLGHDKDLPTDKSQATMQQHCHEVLSLAQLEGINYFDTARGYGLGEKFLASWDNKASNILIGSKWGYAYTANWQINATKHESKDLSVNHFQKQLSESKEILGDNIWLYQIHSATLESGVLEDNSVIDSLWQLRESGIKIGLSVSGVNQAQTIEKALEISQCDTPLFQSVQATYNILEQSCFEILTKAQKLGLFVIIKEGLANGRLTDRNPEIMNYDTLSELGKSYNCSSDILALSFILHKLKNTVVLSGASTQSQLMSNIQACRLNLKPEELSKLSDLVEDSESYWQTRSSLVWN